MEFFVCMNFHETLLCSPKKFKVFTKKPQGFISSSSLCLLIESSQYICWQINLPGESRIHIQSTHIWAEYIPYPAFGVFHSCFTCQIPEIPVDSPARLQWWSQRSDSTEVVFWQGHKRSQKCLQVFGEYIFRGKK